MRPTVAYRLAVLTAVVSLCIASFGRRTSRNGPPPTVGAPAKPPPPRSEPPLARLFRELRDRTAGDPLTIAKALARAGDSAGARAALERALWVARDAGSLVRSEQVRDAGSLLRIEKIQAEMGDREAAIWTLQQALGVANDSDSLVEIGKIQAKMGDREAALKTLFWAGQSALAEARLGWGTAAARLGAIAAMQLQLGDQPGARETFGQLLRVARILDPSQKVRAIQVFVCARAAAGDFFGALENVASIDDPNGRLEALINIGVKDRRRAGTEALGRILRMVDSDRDNPRLSSNGVNMKERVTWLKGDILIELALAQESANEPAEARRTLQRARQVAEDFEADSSRDQCIGRIAKALVKIGAAGEASRIANSIEVTAWSGRMAVLIEIAEGHEEIGDLAAALKALHDALQATRYESEKPDILTRIASVQVKGGDRGAALRALELALTAARNSTVGTPGPTFMELKEAEIAIARAKARDFLGAIRLAATNKNTHYRGYALAEIARLQAAAGDIRGAIHTAETIGPRHPTDPTDLSAFPVPVHTTSSALRGIIEGQAKSGDVAGAMVTADRLRSDGEGYEALLAIAEGLGRWREAAKAHREP